jgi:UDP-N-acetylglucosamine 1-carboxyvinyltransferase
MTVNVIEAISRPGRDATTIQVAGGRPLQGTIAIGGSKNAALPLMAAALLTGEECVFDNVPDLADVHTMGELLGWLGADFDFDPVARRVRIRAATIRTHVAHAELARKMRASFLVTGPLLARTGRMKSPPPGGCKLGERPLDVNVRGFETLGAHISFVDGHFEAETPSLVGNVLYLDYPSHTGTENLMMAATLAKGRTIIKHASAEPEITALADCLNAMGARIGGAGSNCIVIDGVERLHGVHHAVIPDRIEAGTFAIAAAMTGGDVVLDGVEMSHMDPVVHKLVDAGARLETDGGRLRVRGPESLNALNVQALPYPGFPTDLQAAIGALMTQANGESTIFERVYEDRLRYGAELRRLGADVRIEGQIATIYGPARLYGADVTALDIRAGACLVLAGLVAEGTTTIHDIYHLERGYEDLVGKLAGLGAQISYA